MFLPSIKSLYDGRKNVCLRNKVVAQRVPGFMTARIYASSANEDANHAYPFTLSLSSMLDDQHQVPENQIILEFVVKPQNSDSEARQKLIAADYTMFGFELFAYFCHSIRNWIKLSEMRLIYASLR